MDTRETPQLDHQEIEAFKIWYSDSEVEGHSFEDWVAAPDDDVQVVMVYFARRDSQGRPTRLYSSGCDNYAMTPGMGKFTSSFDDPTAVEGHVKAGKYMNRRKLEELEQRAYDDWGQGWLWTATEPLGKYQVPGKMKAGQ